MNPWAILGAAGGALVLIVGAFFYGEHVDSLAWAAKVEQQKSDAAKILADRTQQVLDRERAAQDANAQLEQVRRDADIKTADADSRVRAALERVRRQGRRSCSGNAVRASGSSAGAEDSTGGSASGLAERLDDYTQRCSRGATELKNYVLECNAFVLGLK